MNTYEVTLEVRHNGSPYGTVKELVQADSPDEAELKLMAEATSLAKAMRPGRTFAPLLTKEVN